MLNHLAPDEVFDYSSVNMWVPKLLHKAPEPEMKEFCLVLAKPRGQQGVFNQLFHFCVSLYNDICSIYMFHFHRPVLTLQFKISL